MNIIIMGDMPEDIAVMKQDEEAWDDARTEAAYQQYVEAQKSRR